jgi:hypothetical protein
MKTDTSLSHGADQRAPLSNGGDQRSPSRNGSEQRSPLREDPYRQERFEDEVIMHLERDQFVAETSRPVSRAALSPAAIAALWTLRVFVVLVSLMVIYTFIAQLH